MDKEEKPKISLRVTKMSTRGQVVIPEDIRIELGLKYKDVFTVQINKKSIVLIKLYRIS